MAFLVLYPAAAMLVGYLAIDDRNGILASLFAANAGTALLVALIFGLPQSNNQTSRALSFLFGFIGALCALLSAVHWMADEVDNVWLRIGIISPIVVTLIVLAWFVYKVNEEGAENNGE